MLIRLEGQYFFASNPWSCIVAAFSISLWIASIFSQTFSPSINVALPCSRESPINRIPRPARPSNSLNPTWACTCRSYLNQHQVHSNRQNRDQLLGSPSNIRVQISEAGMINAASIWECMGRGLSFCFGNPYFCCDFVSFHSRSFNVCFATKTTSINNFVCKKTSSYYWCELLVML